jgi:aspartate carbamoyltransferase catalytic subunit
MVEHRPPTPESSFHPEKIINGDFKGKDILSMEQFDPQSLQILFDVTKNMSQIAKYSQTSNVLDGNLVTLLFYEPSSRTMNSFDAAAKQLKGNTLIEKDPKHFSSVAKGETFEDTIRTFEAYCDAIVIRHPEKGSAIKAAIAAEIVPVINAGDGNGEHPTQALLDLYTIYEKYGRLSELKLLFAGDIKNGRTVHSLLKALAIFPDNEISLLSPNQLKLDKTLLEDLRSKGLKIKEISDAKDIPKDRDVWYWTRVQKERFKIVSKLTKVANKIFEKMLHRNPDDKLLTNGEYEKLSKSFIVNPQFLEQYGNDDMVLMHPLPRVGEIAKEVDKDPRAIYLKNQVRNGMYIRMALLALVLGKINPDVVDYNI